MTTQAFSPPLDRPHPFRCPTTGRDLVHVFDDEQKDAVTVALQLERPLLIRGEPGAGKSQLARAVADCLKAAFRGTVVDGQTEGRDLLYTFDLVRRLADAQAAGTKPGTGVDLNPARYIRPGPLWWALNRANVEEFERKRGHARSEGDSSNASRPAVLLIDEIDKADPSVPNSLLEVLADGRFEIPGVGEVVRDGAQPPLIAVTTNEERALPKAFLRRCVVLHLELPREDDGLDEWLMTRGRAHFPDMETAVLTKAAKQLVEDRTEARRRHLYTPGQAEYLDLLRTLEKLTEDLLDRPAKTKRQAALLGKLAPFLFVKERPRR